jgi:hypothetical protein
MPLTNQQLDRLEQLSGKASLTDQEFTELEQLSKLGEPEEAPVSRVAADVGIEAGATLAGTAIGAALAPATFGASIPIGAVVGGTVGGFLGNISVQRGQIARGERPDFSYGELAASTALGAIPGGFTAKIAKSIGLKAGETIASKLATRAAEGSLLSGANEVVKAAVDRGELPKANDFINAVGLGAVTGGAIGTAEAGLTKAVRAMPEVKLGNLTPLIRRIAGEQSALSTEGEFAVENLNKVLSKIPDKLEKERLSSLAMNVLTNKAPGDVLPKDLSDAVIRVRDTIDDLSLKMIDDGIVAEGTPLYDSITDNLNKYVRRSYKIFNSDWRPSQEVFDGWVNKKVNSEIAEKLREAEMSASLAGRRFNRSGAAAEIEREYGASFKQRYINEANDLLDRDNAFSFITGNSKRVNTNLFKKRQNLDDETRQLLGEITDPVVAASQTINMMTKTQATYNALRQIRELGLKEGLFRRNSIAGDVRVSKDDSQFNPLQGLYASPEIRDAFNSVMTRRVNKLVEKFAPIVAASAIAKIPKTIGSVKAYASNLWGGLLDVVAQGHAFELFDSDNWGRASKIAGYNLGFVRPDGSINSKEAENFYKFARAEGLVAPNVALADFMRAWEVGEGSLTKVVGAKVMAGAKKAVGVAGKVYQTPETFSKIFNFSGELKDLMAANPNARLSDLMKEAAERTRMTTNYYDALPQSLRDLSSIGALDPFVAYTADRFRVVYNTYKLALKDLSSGNPVLQKAGARRLASMTTVLGAAGYLGANTHLTPEEDKALRNQMPEWDRNGFVKISTPTADGKFKYTNLNYNLPHSATIEAMSAALNGRGPEEAFTNFMSSIGQQAFGAPLLLAPISQVVTGRNRYGLPITSENAKLYQQVFDKSAYLLDATVIPLAVREAGKLYKTMKDSGQKITDSAGNVYGVEEVLKENFAGVREKTIDIGKRLQLSASNINRDLMNDRIAYRSQFKKSMTSQDTQNAYASFEERYRNTFARATQLVNDARALGVNDEDLITLLKKDKNQIPNSLLLGVISGIYIPPAVEDVNPTKAVYEEIQASVPESKRTAAIEKAARENPTIAQSLVSRYRQDLRNKALKISEIDKLILSQDEADGDRARFIFQKMQTLPDDLMRTAYLEDLRKKRIITPAVNAQLNLLMNPPR